MTELYSKVISLSLFLIGTACWLYAQDPNSMASDSNQNPAIQSQDTVGKQPDETAGYDRYRLIYRQNIFARNRHDIRQQFERFPDRVKKQIFLSLYILRGIAIQGDRRVAFIEDIVSRRTLKGRVGTELLSGTITEVKIEGVVFRINDTYTEVPIGGEFGKTESKTQVPVEAFEISSPVPETQQQQDTAATNDDELLKKMMERRNRELGN